MKRILAAALIALVPTCSFGQSQPSPPLSYGRVPTAGEWNSYFAAKQDILRFTPLNQAGGTMSGKLNTAPATVNGAGFSILPGLAPTSPSDGDLWLTSVNLFARIGGVTTTFANSNDPRITGAAQKSANLSDLASPSTARANLGAAASGANSDITSLTGLTAPLSASQGGTGYASVSTALDGLFSSTQGAILYRGASGWAALAPNAAGYVLTSGGTGANPSWGAAGGATAVLYTAQSLTNGQQDQARANISGPVSSAPSTSTTLATADFDRPLFPTGTPTITMPNGGAGWRSGPIRNGNTLSGLVTLAVPFGATLDGVTNGTTVLRPYQRARIVQTGATAYVTDWIDRTPVVATISITSTAPSVDALVPQGYGGLFSFEISGLTFDTAGGDFGLRLSSNGGSTFSAGASDYYWEAVNASNSGSTVNSTYGGASYIPLIFGKSTSANANLIRGTLFPGTASLYPITEYSASFFDNAGALYNRKFTGLFYPGLALMNAVRFVALTGNITGGTIIIKAPAL